MNLTLDEAKERVTIGELWLELGYPFGPGKSSRCPFHKDRAPSFSVFDDGRRWKCFSGCGEGTVIDFLAKAKGISEEEACREILRRAGANHYEPLPRREKTRPEYVHLPPLVEYNPTLAQTIASSRGLDVSAVDFPAMSLKTIVFGRVCEQKCWILTDASRRCGEARRIVRAPFPAVGTLAERKSHTLPSSSKSWPVGILPPGLETRCDKILLVEGTPDYLAACQLIFAQDENVLPVAMLGSKINIAEDALSHFTNRHVTIVAHPDEAGRGAAERWSKQIQEAGGLVRIFKLKEHDLCDIVASGATNNDLRLF